MLEREKDFEKTRLLLLSIMAILLLTSLDLPVTIAQRHCKGLDVVFYDTPSNAYADLKANMIDLMCYNLDFDEFQDAQSDTNIQLAGFAGLEYFGYDLNNNYTVPTYPGVRNPLNLREFRQALAHAVDKDYIVNTLVQDMGIRIDVPIPAPQSGWWSPYVTGDNYPYEFSMIQASAILDGLGFVDTDADGWRNYPQGWPGREAGPNLDPLIIYIRGDSKSYIVPIGYEIHYRLWDLGIPSVWQIVNNDLAYQLVHVLHDYHIYTSIWTVKKYQPLYWYPMYHSMYWYPGGPNYVTGVDALGMPNYPQLDAELELSYYAPDFESSILHCQYSQEIYVTECIGISLFSPISYMAYRRNLVGVVNMDGYGINNKYTYLNAYKVDDPATPEDESQLPIRIGLPNAPTNLNPLYSPLSPLAPDEMRSNWQVMNEIVYTHLINEEPYNLATDIPWVAQDWEISEWVDFQDGETKTMVTYWIRKDVFWHEPETGAEIRQFTAHDVEFSIWYLYAFGDNWQWHDVKDVKYTRVVDDFTIQVYFDVLSYYAVYWIGEQMPLLPKYEYLNLLCEQRMVEIPITEPILPSTKFVFTADQVVQIIGAIKYPEGIPLIQGVDFEIFATGPMDWCHNEIHWLRPLDPGELIVIWYWTPSLDPHGYYLAGLDWRETWYSLGIYYPVAIHPDYNYALFNCNPGHFLGAPPLGEIDWMWTWVGTTRPRSGYFQVFLFDAVRLLGAYCRHGDGIYDPHWFPGADIDAYDLCHIGLYDAVTALSHYGQRSGTPPDP